MEEREEEDAWDHAEDGVEEEVVGEDGYAEGVLLLCVSCCYVIAVGILRDCHKASCLRGIEGTYS